MDILRELECGCLVFAYLIDIFIISRIKHTEVIGNTLKKYTVIMEAKVDLEEPLFLLFSTRRVRFMQSNNVDRWKGGPVTLLGI